MLAMGYVPGTGLGATGDGRVQPVEARVLPAGKSLDQCMAITEKFAGQDPLKVTISLIYFSSSKFRPTAMFFDIEIRSPNVPCGVTRRKYYPNMLQYSVSG